jgi:hypothetical protein
MPKTPVTSFAAPSAKPYFFQTFVDVLETVTLNDP